MWQSRLLWDRSTVSSTMSTYFSPLPPPPAAAIFYSQKTNVHFKLQRGPDNYISADSAWTISRLRVLGPQISPPSPPNNHCYLKGSTEVHAVTDLLGPHFPNSCRCRSTDSCLIIVNPSSRACLRGMAVNLDAVWEKGLASSQRAVCTLSLRSQPQRPVYLTYWTESLTGRYIKSL